MASWTSFFDEYSGGFYEPEIAIMDLVEDIKPETPIISLVEEYPSSESESESELNNDSDFFKKYKTDIDSLI
jgi:hypothetical protein